MTTAADPFIVGAYVLGGTDSPRDLKPHGELLTAYADGTIDDHREAYLSHFAYGSEMRRHFAANRNSVAGYVGPCGCRYLVLDIDRGDLAAALCDCRKLVSFVHWRYPDLEGDVPIYFSGGKGFHVLLELTHRPPPTVGFPAVAKTLAEGIAANAGLKLDTGIYFANALVRLPNTKHPKTGRFKRRIDADVLFRLNIGGVLEHARHPAGDGIPTAWRSSEELALDWSAAEAKTARATEARAAIRRDAGTAPDARAPKFFIDLLRFGVEEGDRHKTLFRSAAWLAEQGAPPSLCFALLTEAGCDVGLSPTDVGRQIRCGIEHADRQRGGAAVPDRLAAPGAEGLPPGALDFPLGLPAPAADEGGAT